MIGIIDYGVGNLFSLQASCKAIGQDVFVSGDGAELQMADRLILPGVGAFPDAAKKLNDTGMADFVREEAARGTPLLGICLGMQLLFEESLEYGRHPGLGLLKGQVVPMEGRLPEGLKIPHMGWNTLNVTGGRLLEGLGGQYVYFVHSFFGENCADSLSAWTDYGIPITAAVEQGNLFGCQFNPEKSGSVGLSILRRFAEI